MVETTDARQRGELRAGRGLGFGFSACRGVADRGVDPLGAVVLDVLAKEASQVDLAVTRRATAPRRGAVPIGST